MHSDEMDLAAVPGFDLCVNGPRKEIERLLVLVANHLTDETARAEAKAFREECANLRREVIRVTAQRDALAEKVVRWNNEAYADRTAAEKPGEEKP